MDEKSEKPAKSVKRPKKKRTSPSRNVEPRQPPSDALVDPTTIPDDLREFIYQENQLSRKYAIENLLDAAEKYSAEKGRDDGLHRARLNKREETLMLCAEDLVSTHRVFFKLTYGDLERWQQRMEWAAERERNKPASKPLPKPMPELGPEEKAETAQLIPFQRRPIDPSK